MPTGAPTNPLGRFLRRVRRSFDYRVGRLQSRVACEINALRESNDDRQREQMAKFSSIGLDRDSGVEAVDLALRACGFGAFSEDDDMFSEHLVLLGAVSRAIPSAQRVLEIGTYDGRAALILSQLFPAATITTIDLPPDDPVYGDSYEQARSKQFVARRNGYLSRNERVQFIELNSLGLSRYANETGYDVIWVDGDHDFPVVGMDLSNATRLLRPGGFLLCDDVVTAKPSRSTTYLSDAAHRSLVALHGAGLIEKATYVYKRLGKRHQHPRKFVAITKTKAASRAS